MCRFPNVNVEYTEFNGLLLSNIPQSIERGSTSSISTSGIVDRLHAGRRPSCFDRRQPRGRRFRGDRWSNDCRGKDARSPACIGSTTKPPAGSSLSPGPATRLHGFRRVISPAREAAGDGRTAPWLSTDAPPRAARRVFPGARPIRPARRPPLMQGARESRFPHHSSDTCPFSQLWWKLLPSRRVLQACQLGRARVAFPLDPSKGAAEPGCYLICRTGRFAMNGLDSSTRISAERKALKLSISSGLEIR